MISRKDFLKAVGLGVLVPGVFGDRALGFPRAFGGAPDRTGPYRGVKITGVDIFLMDLALKQPFTIAIGTITAANDILVKVHTDAGITGLGEACPAPPITGETQAACVAVARDVRQLVGGREPTSIDSSLASFGAVSHSAPSVA
ncbi:MAG: hypothetical protein ABFD80_12515, partial [Acidobacteriota bacterium]